MWQFLREENKFKSRKRLQAIIKGSALKKLIAKHKAHLSKLLRGLFGRGRSEQQREISFPPSSHLAIVHVVLLLIYCSSICS